MTRGVVVIAFGEKAKTEARLLHESLLAANEVYPWHTIEPVYRAPSSTTVSRYAKTTMLADSPFEEMLYLDADTRVNGIISDGFDILSDGWDIAMAPSANQDKELMWHISEKEVQQSIEYLGYEPLALQCGVMFIARNERTQAFFEEWHRQWLGYCQEDQAAFLRALSVVPLKIWLLGRPWNGGALIGHRFGMLRT